MKTLYIHVILDNRYLNSTIEWIDGIFLNYGIYKSSKDHVDIITTTFLYIYVTYSSVCLLLFLFFLFFASLLT